MTSFPPLFHNPTNTRIGKQQIPNGGPSNSRAEMADDQTHRNKGSSFSSSNKTNNNSSYRVLSPSYGSGRCMFPSTWPQHIKKSENKLVLPPGNVILLQRDSQCSNNERELVLCTVTARRDSNENPPVTLLYDDSTTLPLTKELENTIDLLSSSSSGCPLMLKNGGTNVPCSLITTKNVVSSAKTICNVYQYLEQQCTLPILSITLRRVKCRSSCTIHSIYDEDETKNALSCPLLSSRLKHNLVGRVVMTGCVTRLSVHFHSSTHYESSILRKDPFSCIHYKVVHVMPQSDDVSSSTIISTSGNPVAMSCFNQVRLGFTFMLICF